MKVEFADKFVGTLLGVAIGDTLGHPFEGQLRERILSHFELDMFEDFVQKNKNYFKTYTDDTQLTIHTAKALIDAGRYDQNIFIKHYVNWLSDPPIGPGYGCISSIRKLKHGISPEDASSNSGGNGTTMRIAPIGLFFSKSLTELKQAAIESSKITHSHPAASAGALVIARAIAYLLNKNPKNGFSHEEFFKTIIDPITNSGEEIWDEFIDILNRVKHSEELSIETGLIKFSQIGVKTPYFIQQYLGKAFVHPYTLSTVTCALFIFLKTQTDFKKCIFTLATAGGDTDTVAAIGGSLIGAYYGRDYIPETLIKLVKKSKSIIKLSEQLYSTFISRF